MLERSLRPFLRPAGLSRKAQYRTAPSANRTVDRNATIRVDLDRSGPILLGIFGTEDALHALVRLPDGTVVQVGRGEKLGNRDVVGIDAQGIVLARGAHATRLPLP